MSPSSSALPLSYTTAKARSRHNSTQQDPSAPSPISRNSSKQNLPAQQNVSTKRPPHYTVFIRLPFRRASFEDPPPVEWDAGKDRRLWKLISGSHSGKGDLDWEGLSNDFGVDLSFLLMQAAWLSERHMERIRKQVGRISGGGESAIGSASAVGGIKMERTGSRESKAASGSTSTAAGRSSPSYPGGLTVETSNTPGTSTPVIRVPISRTPSSATVTQSKITSSLSRQPQQLQRTVRGSSGSGRRPTPTSATNSPRDEYYEDAVEHEGASDSDSENEPSAMARSQAFRRPPISRKAQKSKLGTLGSDGDGEDDEDDSGDSFLPFAAIASKPNSKPKEDPSATLRTPTSNPAPTSKSKPIREDSTTTASSASSAAEESSGRPAHPLSPRHRAQLNSLSPRGSEGSPSMGSSFSDLDDASLSRSALEDALMSNMRQGGGSLAYGSTMASRMSSLRDALGRRTGGN